MSLDVLSEPQPKYAWTFNSTTTDYIASLTPTLTGGSPTYVTGINGQAINFPNSTSTGTVNPTNNVIYTVSLNPLIGYTISFWVNFNIGSVASQVIMGLAYGSGSKAVNVYLDAANKLNSYDQTSTITISSPTLSTSTWYHVALSVSSSGRVLYLNGVGTSGACAVNGAQTTFILGGDFGSNSAWCSYDDLRVYNSVLTPTQVQSIYLQNAIPTTSLPVMKFPQFSCKFDRDVYDFIGGVNGTLTVPGSTVYATGGTVTSSGNNRIHTFTTVGSQTFTVLQILTAQVLIVAGGGAGGAWGGAGGGGAGGLVYLSSVTLTPGTYTVTVGNGGSTTSANGDNSVFSTYTAIGGGGGATNSIGNTGGSGGGSQSPNPLAIGGSGTPGQGNNGGIASVVAPAYGGGGGGGAGGVGQDGSGTSGGNGGVGLQYSISGTPTYYAGGGGGAGGTGGTGGLGGGGNSSQTSPAVSATPNTGGGGGACGTVGGVAGSGGSGIVIISYYPDSYTSGKYNQAISIQNTAGGTSCNYVTWNLSSFNTSGFTIAAWVRPLVISGPNTIYQLDNNFVIYVDSTKVYASFDFYKTPSTFSTVSNTINTLNTWTHVAATITSGPSTSNVLTLYVNGAYCGNVISTTSQQATFANLYLGQPGAVSQAYNGLADDLRLYNKALTLTQINNIYNSQGMMGGWSNSAGILKSNFYYYHGAPALYVMKLPFTFTNMGATGSSGPSSVTYGTSTPGLGTPYELVLGTGTSAGMQRWTVPATRTYTFTVAGAGMTIAFGPGVGDTPGSYFNWAVKGAVGTASVSLTAGHVLRILVGQKPLYPTSPTVFNSCGGCGGTFIYNETTSTLLMVAGGGGGCGCSGGGANQGSGTSGNPYTNGYGKGGDASLTTTGGSSQGNYNVVAGGTNGQGGQAQASFGGASGAGYSGNGAASPQGGGAPSPFTGGGTGGTSTYGGNATSGGFGGGGGTGTLSGGGGGGGYSGGGAGNTDGSGFGGGGGGSYINGSWTSIAANNSDMGYVIVSF
jgi:Concanavalin A-like lectin/glucanases superfamily